MSNCTALYTRDSEFSTHAECDIPSVAYFALKLTSISISGLVFILELIWLTYRWTHISRKDVRTKILIFWAISQNLVMALRPVTNLLLNKTSAQSLAVAFITHISAALAAGIVVLFIYIELTIIYNASLNQKVGFWITHRGGILLFIGITQGLLFLLGPFLTYFVGMRSDQVFWIPVIVIDFTLIPYFAVLGFVIRRRILSMVNEDFTGLAKRILYVTCICAAVGIFTGTVGLYAVFGTPYEWILVEICWISDNVFNGVFFTVFSRKPKKRSPRK